MIQYQELNLDEEAVRLNQMKQIYEATAKVIATSNVVFDTLISSLR